MIPISTDAPIYHYPIATVGMIAINVVCYFAFCLDNTRPNIVPRNNVAAEKIEQLDEDDAEITVDEVLDLIEFEGTTYKHLLAVQFGRVRPWQWVTGNFMHADIMHLIGNMIFLWGFGLIVEGKVGWWRFAGIYLVIGTIYGMVLQLGSLLFSSSAFALGASAAIFGLLALCVIWAPANEFTVVMFLVRVFMFDMSILFFGFFFFAKEVVFFGISGFQMSSELLHILGFCAGLPLGIIMVKQGFVDCEGWDIFSYLSGKTGKESTIQTRESVREKEQLAIERKNSAIKQKEISQQVSVNLVGHFREALEGNNIDLAIRLLGKLQAYPAALQQLSHEVTRLVQLLLHSKRYNEAATTIEMNIGLFADHRFAMEVTMLKIWLRDKLPRRSMVYMQKMNAAAMDDAQRQQLVSLAGIAKKQIADGVVDLV